MPTLEEIAIETAKIREENLERLRSQNPEIPDYYPHIYRRVR